MFRHQGKKRSAKNNLQIAVVLSFVAGIVNVVGFLFLSRLTTNVTGHFAFFIHDISIAEFWKGTIYLCYILSFLCGSFTSGWLIEDANYHKRQNKYFRPTLLECLTLGCVILFNTLWEHFPHELTTFMLLYAMGLQNSFVTKISNATVRTTHLTGLFTDLGIELSQLFYIRRNNYLQQEKNIKNSIRLRLFIVVFFFLGGFFAGFAFVKLSLGIKTLFFAIAILLAGLYYDDVRFRYLTERRKHRKPHLLMYAILSLFNLWQYFCYE